MPRNLDLALIGNGAIGLLVDSMGAVVWGCFPRFDGDATFCALLDDAAPGEERGIYVVEIVEPSRAEQSYCTNTAVLVTRLFDQSGGAIEITDCVPRFMQHGRVFHPMTHVRTVRRVAGRPRIRVRLRPAAGYGRAHPAITVGSSHIRYVMPGVTLRLTTDASLTAILEERPFFLGESLTLLLGPDETVPSAVDEVGRRFVEETIKYWHDWVRRLAIPFEWQGAVIRAAITLQQNAYDDTGAIVAAMTTSVPEAAGSSRNWDYRYCWLRDGYFVVDALNRLGATETMEGYLGYIVGIVAASGESAAARLSHQRRFRARRGDREIAARLSRPGPRADRQRRVPAGAARCLRLGGARVHARVLRRAAGQARRRRALRAARNPRPAGARRATTSPMPACGSCAAAHARAHVLERDVLGGLRPAVPHRDTARDRRSRPRVAQRCRTHSALRRRAVLERGAAILRRHGRRRHAGCEPAAAGRPRLPATRGSAVRPDGARDRGRAEARRLHLSLRRAGRFRRARERLRGLLVLVRQRARRARPSRRGARAVRAAARLPQSRTACSPSTSTRAPASIGATSCRPTAWWA